LWRRWTYRKRLWELYSYPNQHTIYVYIG